jgi:RNA polymerase sigma factor (TIGR02999 family)
MGTTSSSFDRDGSLQLGPELYGELRRLAGGAIARERGDHNLQATALVNEAWLRLSADRRDLLTDKGRFLAAAAESMRRILVDHARRRGRLKHGGGARMTSLTEAEPASETASASAELAARDEQLLLLDGALAELEAEDPRKAMVVEARYFLGLGLEAIARSLGVSRNTVKRDWTFARAWLQRRLEEGRR